MAPLFNKSTNKRVGLDIGSHSLKLIEINKRGDEFYLTAVGAKSLPPDTIENGELKKVSEFIDAVKHLVDQCDPTIVDVVISLNGQGLLSDKFRFKVAPNENVNDMVLYEASQRSPFDSEDITTSYKILNHFPESDEVEILLVAAKNYIVQAYIDALYQAGLRPIVVDVDIYALNNCYALESVSEGALDTLCLLDVGNKKTRVAFIRDGLFHSSREINTATSYFVEGLQKQLRIPESDAQKLLRNRIPENVSEESFLSALDHLLEEFCSNFNMALSYLKKNESFDRLDKIVVAGGGAYIPKLIEYFGNYFDTEVVRSNPFHFLKYDDDLFGGNTPPAELESLISVSVGLATREIN
ncbi:type IV pilus assembly protein PilM [Chitinivibrio alkaliphilus]|uniref:Type IV pilus assembly protein PilM n=1 Tax=Chitinivibrio alkaliphilus ACht1 TaxID=1313304 RepID=U7D936_9BACT|nr:type IV pilus assembly protein PilM [Chitinivibrio alkaliphilus]ERP30910.1 type IV pilus assembly protein PilM [Chitinivibrio alkaliphilus ACht1]